MFNRRSFLKYTGGTTLTLFTYGKFGVKEALAAIPGGTLDPSLGPNGMFGVPKFQDPMLIPPAMPRAGVLFRDGKWIDYYEISMRQFAQQIMPKDFFPKTTVWGYGPVKVLNPFARKYLNFHNAPSFTIEALHNVPVRIKWINELKDPHTGNYLPHLLPVDPTLHWANPSGGTDGRDMRPDMMGKTFVPLASFNNPSVQYTQYTGPVPMVTHVHGAVAVGDESDGYAEAWFLPDANGIPASYAKTGTWYDFFAGKASRKFGVTWGPGFSVNQYPNPDRASTNWYHDHTLGMTRLNVYAGPAGFYNIRGGPAGDIRVRNKNTGRIASLPGPAPNELNQLIPGIKFHEIAIAIQDRSFNVDGSLFYPNTRAFFPTGKLAEGFPGPYIGQDGPSREDPTKVVPSDIAPIWNPEFFGNMIMVNGNIWPYLEVEQRRYRFRFLNGCQSRFLILDFNSIPGVEVWQIGNEGGFLETPVNHTDSKLAPARKGRILMGLAERADVIVDFTNVAVNQSFVLRNVGPDEPFGGGIPHSAAGAGDGDFEPADPATTGQVLEFRVRPIVGKDVSTHPGDLLLPQTVVDGAVIKQPRRLALIEEVSALVDEPSAALLGTVTGDPSTPQGGVAMKQLWMDPVTENPAAGAIEVWEIYNTTVDAHPMHIHEVAFEVLDRQSLMTTADGETAMPIKLSGDPIPREAWETGFKDTVIAYPGQVTRVKMKFESEGQYTWHCHIVEHEDNEMMRPYRIGPVQPGQPG